MRRCTQPRQGDQEQQQKRRKAAVTEPGWRDMEGGEAGQRPVGLRGPSG